MANSGGIRIQEYRRHVLSCHFLDQEMPYGKIRLKKSEGYGTEKVKPEYEDLARIARKNDISLETAVSQCFRDL